MADNDGEISRIKEELSQIPILNQVLLATARTQPIAIEFNLENANRFPSLFNLVNQALRDANAASVLDQPIQNSTFIMLDSNPTLVRGGAVLHRNEQGGTAIRISTSLLNSHTYEEAVAVLTHEFAHSTQNPYVLFKQTPPGADPEETNAPKRILELDADRSSADEVALIKFLLGDVSHSPAEYKFSEIGQDHDNTRKRVEVMLREAYADKGLSGKFETDCQFHLKTQDFLPITEDGRKVANYYTEVLPAMEKQVAKDLKVLDQLFAKELTNAEMLQFIDHLRQSIPEFRAEHPLKLQAPDNEFLSTQFAESLKDPRKVEAAMAMHPGMPSAYAAWKVVEQHAGHFVSEDAQNAFLETGKQNLIVGIREGRFPDMECHVELTPVQPISQLISVQENSQ